MIGAVQDAALRESLLEGGVKRMGDNGLPVIVVDLHPVESLEEGKAITEQRGDVPAHLGNERIVSVKLASAVDKRVIDDGEMLRVDEEQLEVRLPRFEIKVLEGAVAMHKGSGVEGGVCKPSLPEPFGVSGQVLLQAIGLIVEHEGEDVILGATTLVA